jgi:hypothetical protein
MKLLQKIVAARFLTPNTVRDYLFDFDKDDMLMRIIMKNGATDHLLNDHMKERGYSTFSFI